jgi:DNA polymerase-3 subunit epsilon
MYAVVDLETTGSHPNHDNIIEIAVYLHNGTEVTDQFCTLLNPGVSIPHFISKLTGITNEMVATAPTFQDIAPKLATILEGRVFVAHNVQFDHSFLKQSMIRHGYEISEEMLCTVKTGRALVPGLASYKLSSLCKALEIRLDNAHRAYADALATAHILSFLHAKAEGNLTPYRYQREAKKNLSRIPAETIDELPSQAGLLHFLNENGQIILTNASSNIRKKAWSLIKRFHHKRLLPLATEATSIRYEITNSEILASILEIQACDPERPKFNRTPKVFEGRFIITDHVNKEGVLQLQVSPYKPNQPRLRAFSSISEARRHLSEVTKRYDLNTIAPSKQVAMELDDNLTHQQKIESACQWIKSGIKNQIIHDKLTQNGDQTLFWVNDETVIGYCTLNRSEGVFDFSSLRDRLILLPDNPSIFRTVHRFIAKGKFRKIINIENA